MGSKRGRGEKPLPSGARSTGRVHRLTPSDESGAQKDGTNRFRRHCKVSWRGLPARTVRQAERDPHIDFRGPVGPASSTLTNDSPPAALVRAKLTPLAGPMGGGGGPVAAEPYDDLWRQVQQALDGPRLVVLRSHRAMRGAVRTARYHCCFRARPEPPAGTPDRVMAALHRPR